MKRLSSQFIAWFEGGELAPLIIIVSVPHYAMVLARYDFCVVAAALGFLLDLSHYRTIKAYQAGRGIFWMVVLTIFSFGFHFAFYMAGGAAMWQAAFFGAAVPVVIFALSFLSYTERWGQKASKAAATPAPTTVSAPQVPALTTTDTPALPPASAAKAYSCEKCGASFARAAQYSAHVRWKHTQNAEVNA